GFCGGGSSRMPDGPLQFPGEQPQPSAGFQQPPAGFQQPSAGFQEPPGSQPQAGFADRTAVSRPAAGGSRHGGGIGQARIKEAPFGAAPAAMEAIAVGQEAAAKTPANAAPRQPWYQVVGEPSASMQASAQVIDVAEAASQANRAGPADAMPVARGGRRAELPFAAPHPQGHPPTADGRQNCGPLESILWRR